ncbi:hypothetical protein LCGC14_1927670 [marine sediment metagenome]|uniref:Uncharacterized protein n=1 Tax=marine sediment metagenome TaxID=412755 RepID=A0A0F9FPI2_9ZZZZ
MKKRANPGEIARARRERGRARDILKNEVEVSGGVDLIHLGGAVGLRIGVAVGQRELVERLLKDAGILVPYTVRETDKPQGKED